MIGYIILAVVCTLVIAIPVSAKVAIEYHKKVVDTKI